MSQMKEIHAVPVFEDPVVQEERRHDLIVDCWCEPIVEEYSDLVPGGAKRVVVHRDVEMPA